MKETGCDVEIKYLNQSRDATSCSGWLFVRFGSKTKGEWVPRMVVLNGVYIAAMHRDARAEADDAFPGGGPFFFFFV